jgi:beta-lactamase class A
VDKHKNTKPLRLKRRLITLLTLAALFGCALGVFSAYLWFTSSYYATRASNTIGDASNARALRLGERGLINPLLEYVTPQDLPQLTLFHDAMAKQVDYEESHNLATKIGVYWRDLEGHWVGVNEGDPFSPASLLKVPVMIAYLKLAESQPAILTNRFTYDGSFDANTLEDLKPLKSLQAGQSYTVDELLKFMIGYSDNNANDILFNNLPPGYLQQIFKDLKVPFPSSQSDYLGPRTYSLFFRILYNATYLNEDMSQKALELLAYPDFPEGISASVPEKITVAQKFGEHVFPDGTNELHDCGIVYYPTRPYILCVMTKGTNLIDLTKVIQSISAMVYREVDSNPHIFSAQ